MIVSLGNKQPKEKIKPYIRLKPSSLVVVFFVLGAFVGGYLCGKTLYQHKERNYMYNLKPIKLYIYDEKGDSLLYYLESYQKQGE